MRFIEELREGLDRADRVSRECARAAASVAEPSKLLGLVERLTGGLGYRSDTPFDPAQMVVAGTVIAWPEAVRNGSRVLEIGTGLGRTCYVIHYAATPSLYVTVDYSPEVLALALYANPSKDFASCLQRPDVKIVLLDAVEAVKRLPSSWFDHVVHDGGPNPVRNPRLYSVGFLSQLYRVMKPCATLSVFAGRSRAGRNLVYSSLVRAGFQVLGVESFHDSPAAVYRARKPCSGDKA